MAAAGCCAPPPPPPEGLKGRERGEGMGGKARVFGPSEEGEREETELRRGGASACHSSLAGMRGMRHRNYSNGSAIPPKHRKGVFPFPNPLPFYRLSAAFLPPFCRLSAGNLPDPLPPSRPLLQIVHEMPFIHIGAVHCVLISLPAACQRYGT